MHRPQHVQQPCCINGSLVSEFPMISLLREVLSLPPDTTFVKNLQTTMRAVRPTAPEYNGNQKSYVPSNLCSTGYVYIRHDSHRHPLQRPYDGPYRIIDCRDKYYTLDINGKNEKVSIDRLKVAHVMEMETKPHARTCSRIFRSTTYTDPTP